MRTYENLFPEKRSLITKRTADTINFIITLTALVITNVVAEKLNIPYTNAVMIVVGEFLRLT